MKSFCVVLVMVLTVHICLFGMAGIAVAQADLPPECFQNQVCENDDICEQICCDIGLCGEGLGYCCIDDTDPCNGDLCTTDEDCVTEEYPDDTCLEIGRCDKGTKGYCS